MINPQVKELEREYKNNISFRSFNILSTERVNKTTGEVFNSYYVKRKDNKGTISVRFSKGCTVDKTKTIFAIVNNNKWKKCDINGYPVIYINEVEEYCELYIQDNIQECDDDLPF